jgi:hypothetical protein
MKTYTDFPIVELGDNEFSKAPIRECEVLSYDGNIMLQIKIEGVLKEVKRSFVYKIEGRFTEVESITDDEVNLILANNSYTSPVYYKPSFSNNDELKKKPIEEQIKHMIWALENDPHFYNLISDKQFDDILKSIKKQLININKGAVDLWRDENLINLIKADLRESAINKIGL